MSTLLVDNYDSYTYNVFHLLAAVSGEEPIVIHNDMVSWRALSRWDFDAIVLSPGPGRPERWHDFGVCSDILRCSEIPVLGVCLGHQGLGHVLSGLVGTAPAAMHGRLSQVQHLGCGLFEGIPQDFSVVRYHSLAVTGPLEPEGRVTAWTPDGVVMGIEHRHRPLWGVQFHPESIATEHGKALIENFYTLARRRSPPRSRRANRPVAPPRRPRRPRARPGEGIRSGEDTRPGENTRPSEGARSGEDTRPGEGACLDEGAHPQLSVRSIVGEPPTEPLFERLFGDAEYAFWLDSADAPTRLAQRSYLGTTAGPARLVLEYDVEEGRVTRHAAAGTTAEYRSIFDALDHELSERAIEPPTGVERGLLGGFVGYLGYECKADCGSPNAHRSDVPDAVLILANRVVAVDHTSGCTHLLALGLDEDAARWLEEAEAVVREMLAARPPASPQPARDAAPSASPQSARDAAPSASPQPAHTISQPAQAAAGSPGEAATAGDPGAPVTFRCGRGREQYLADIIRCQVALTAGESYEVCLTDQLSTTASPEPFQLYRLLRARNPAPFAAYLKLGEVAVLSSSPERFLAVDRDRRVQARPIKGTAPRAADPAEDEGQRAQLLHDEKTFAEHLMIVDLLRNDLGRVCELDSVRVPELMVVESYPTVHQLISTVTGLLEPERTPVDCVRACFPGGSMTGAPKLRTMGIIDDIERVARGVYSGALGYFGLDGSVDLSIVIRTIVLRPGATTIGAGGAIVTQSDPAQEFDELLLKARAPMTAIAQAVTGSDAPGALTIELEPTAMAATA